MLFMKEDKNFNVHGYEQNRKKYINDTFRGQHLHFAATASAIHTDEYFLNSSMQSFSSKNV